MEKKQEMGWLYDRIDWHKDKKKTDKLIYLKKTARRRLLSNCYRKCKFNEGKKNVKWKQENELLIKHV